MTFEELIASRVPIAPAEAVALTGAVVRLLDAGRSAGRAVALPDDEYILLSSSGEVSLAGASAAEADDETKRLSALLKRLLRVNSGAPAEPVPGALLILIARNLRDIDIPATTPAAFRDSLQRFGEPDATVLASVFWRAAGARRAMLDMSARAATRAAKRVRRDRRRHQSSPTDLRRALRATERELFYARIQLAACDVPRGAALPSGRFATSRLVASCALILLGLAVWVGSVQVPAAAPVTGSSVLTLPASSLPPATIARLAQSAPHTVVATERLARVDRAPGIVRQRSTPERERVPTARVRSVQEPHPRTPDPDRKVARRGPANVPGGTRPILWATAR